MSDGLVGAAAQSGANAWQRWILARREPEAIAGPEGSWTLLNSPRYTKTLLFAGLCFLAFALSGLGYGLHARKASILAPSPPDPIVGWLILVVFGSAALASFLFWNLSRRTRLRLTEAGIGGTTGAWTIPWGELSHFQARMNPKTFEIEDLFLFSRHGKSLEIGAYMDGLGRLRAELAARAPQVLAPLAVSPTAMFHPLEFLPPLRDGQTWDPLRSLAPADLEREPRFELIVESMKEPVAFMGTHRTAIQASVSQGNLHIGDWIAPPAGENPTERTFVLRISDTLASKPLAKAGQRVVLHLFGTGHRWIRTAGRLAGRPLGGSKKPGGHGPPSSESGD